MFFTKEKEADAQDDLARLQRLTSLPLFPAREGIQHDPDRLFIELGPFDMEEFEHD